MYLLHVKVFCNHNSDFPFSRNMYNRETSQIIYNTNRITGSLIMRVSIETLFQMEFN